MHDNNTSNRKGILVIKGAVEVLLDKIDEHQKPLSAFERKANEVANEGYRVIAMP
jgi:magnesium-transporting ATPase (P-type)